MEKGTEILPGYPIEAYLQSNDARWKADTRAGNRRMLQQLQQYLAGSTPDAEILRRWKQALQESGYRQHSINCCISAANNYFRWCGRHDLVMANQRVPSEPTPELTRAEYLRMLRTARGHGWHQLYLLVKLFAVTGVPLQCLEQITPQVVQAGHAVLPCRSNPFHLHLPESLRRELLDYIEDQHLATGPVFVTRSGNPINRSNLCRKMQELCREAGVAPEKGNPRCLRNLCRTTKDTLYANMEQQLRQVYDLLLQAEQESAGWPAEA